MNTTKLEYGLAGNDRYGWYVRWQHGQGYRSAMPDRETALAAAAAPEMAEALTFMANRLAGLQSEIFEPNGERPNLAELRDLENRARAILAKIGGAE